MPTIAPDRLALLPRFVLRSGCGHLDDLPLEGPVEGLCVMQVCDYLTSGGQSDHPDCSDPVVTAFAIRLNDAAWPTNADRTAALAPLIPLIAGSRSTDEVRRRRMFACADWAVREILPMVLELRGFKEEAVVVRAIPALIDAASARSARAAIEPVCARLRAAWSAAAAADAAWSAAAAADAAAAAADAAAAAWSAAAAADARLAARQGARLGVLRKAAEFLKTLCLMSSAS